MPDNKSNILKKGYRARVPVIMQLEALECGAAALAMIMAYYRKWVPLEQVRRDCGVSRNGSNAKNMLIAARNYGFDAQGMRCETDALRSDVTLPCIIHWNFNHFVVLTGFRGKYAYINDPARGNLRVTYEELDRAFTDTVVRMLRQSNENMLKYADITDLEVYSRYIERKKKTEEFSGGKLFHLPFRDNTGSK